MLKYVLISDCVHFRGYRYGGYGNNIYEDYILGLAEDRSLQDLRLQFLRRVLSFDARDFQKAFNLNLAGKYNLWRFPWDIGRFRSASLTPSNNPDIICHVSSEGVLASHVNREYFWLERAYKAMKDGYDPANYGYIRLMPLRGSNTDRFIVLDGNHRLAALHAAGEKRIFAKIETCGIRRRFLYRFWPRVLSGEFSSSDAKQIFDAYFCEKNLDLSENIVQKLILDEPLVEDSKPLI